jgi:hypothetical protein
MNILITCKFTLGLTGSECQVVLENAFSSDAHEPAGPRLGALYVCTPEVRLVGSTVRSSPLKERSRVPAPPLEELGTRVLDYGQEYAPFFRLRPEMSAAKPRST